MGFEIFLNKRMEAEETPFFSLAAIARAYYIGAYARAVIQSSYESEVSKGNTTFKQWLSNQLINAKNLDRIFEKAFEFEQKLKLKIRNDSAVRKLAHTVPYSEAKGMSNAKISYAFVCGYDDYKTYQDEYRSTKGVRDGE